MIQGTAIAVLTVFERIPTLAPFLTSEVMT
jgi:hypothetical protein